MVKISIIIPAKNEEDYVEGCLKSFKNQTFKDYELIIVDGFSNDKTELISKKYGKVVHQDGIGISNARNCGAKVAKGKILVFSDADVRVEKNFLSKVWKEFSKSKIGGAVPKIKVYDSKRYSIKFGYNIYKTIIDIANKIGKGSTIGGCFIFRKDIFEKVGGFNENLITVEDTDLARRVSKISKFKKINVVAKISARRANNQNPLKYVLKSITAYMIYSLNKRSYPPYWEY